MRTDLSLALVALALAGCATPYQEQRWYTTGGVAAKQISSDTLLVSAKGNLYTKSDTVQQYAYRKAAEATLAAGNDWFAPSSSRDSSRTGYAGSNFGSTFLASPLILPGETMTVKMGKNPRPDGAMDARDVIEHLAK